MGLTTEAAVLGWQVKFFKNGSAFTVPTSGTASKTALPGEADPAWVDIPDIAELSMTPSSDKIEVYKSSPGRKVLDDVIATKDKLAIKFKSQEVSPIALQALFKSGTLTGASTSFTIMAGTQLKGWLYVKAYNADNVKIFEFPVFVHLELTGDVTGGDALVEFEFEGLVLNNPLSVGTIA
jgi:hypothetical protein